MPHRTPRRGGKSRAHPTAAASVADDGARIIDTGFTDADLLAELDAVFPVRRCKAEGEMTAWDYARERGLSYVTARYRLRRLTEDGVLERVTGVVDPSRGPASRPVTVWRRRQRGASGEGGGGAGGG